jgi:hypothetical protein
MLFTAATLRGLGDGTVDRTYRRWRVVRPRVGSRFTTRVGVVEVTSVNAADVAGLADEDARRAGFASVRDLARWVEAKGEGDLYVIGLRLAGPDPRLALREETDLSPEQWRALHARLARIDRAAERPWTREALELIDRHPGVVSTRLAEAAGYERFAFKARIRRLKALGLTESLPVGYRLSPRGSAYLARADEFD